MSTEDADIQKQVRTANRMWADYQVAIKTKDFAAKSAGDRLGYFHAGGYGEFMLRYIVPARYMVCFGEYREQIFENYLRRAAALVRAGKAGSKDEWAERQADYVRMLWRSYNPRASQAEGNRRWEDARRIIAKEMEGFQEDYKSAKSQVDERQKQIDDDRRNILRSYLAADVDRLEAVRGVVESLPARAADPDDAPPEKTDDAAAKPRARDPPRVVRRMELDHRAYLEINVEAARRAAALRGVSDKKRRTAEKQFRKQLIDAAIEGMPVPTAYEEPICSQPGISLVAALDTTDLPDDDDW